MILVIRRKIRMTLNVLNNKADPAIRYAEILLIYAEALNELTGSYEIPSWDGSKVHFVKRDVTEMKKGIRPIRIRAGLPDYDNVQGHETAYDDPNEFPDDVKTGTSD